jgi:hypothetical protein
MLSEVDNLFINDGRKEVKAFVMSLSSMCLNMTVEGVLDLCPDLLDSFLQRVTTFHSLLLHKHHTFLLPYLGIVHVSPAPKGALHQDELVD